ncbi:ATP-grasp domain-containing protein [Bacillus sp. A301a_S52]|jgi:D-alanine-D-alanine ligase-like ATP-grasp enzyme|nr:ATP-grasp domain-containing protein [Bacillus sp. A301a_S52]
MSNKNLFVILGGFSSRKYPFLLKSILDLGLDFNIIDEEDNYTEVLIKKVDSNHPLSKVNDVFICYHKDQSAILNKIADWSVDRKIVGVFGLKEVFVEAAALVADYLQLLSPGLKAAKISRNKVLQRLYFEKISPKFKIIPENQRSQLGNLNFDEPFVLKPINRASSSGVIRVNNQEQLDKVIDTYPNDEDLLIEQLIVGREFSVETLINDKEVIFENITEKLTNENSTDYFVELAHKIPATNLSSEVRKKLFEINRYVLKELNFISGISHAEYKVTNSGEVYFIEIAVRPPGDGIMELYFYGTGRPIEQEIINICIGREATYQLSSQFVQQVFLDHPEGLLEDIEIREYDIKPIWTMDYEIIDIPKKIMYEDQGNIRQIKVEKKKGSKLESIKSSYDRAVSFIIVAETEKKLKSLECKVKKNINIKVRS